MSVTGRESFHDPVRGCELGLGASKYGAGAMEGRDQALRTRVVAGAHPLPATNLLPRMIPAVVASTASVTLAIT